MKTEDQCYRITSRNIHDRCWRHTGDVLLSWQQAVYYAAKANRMHLKKSPTQEQRHVFAVIDESGRIVWSAKA